MADIIDTLAAMSDADLSVKLGFNDKLKEAKEDIGELVKLDGDARKGAVERVTKLLNPSIYSDELGWIADSAKRKASTAAGAMCDCSPDSLIDD